LVQAIYATGYGFLLLAEHDYPGAAAAFESAAIFGTVGAGAAIAGRAVAPKQGSASTGAAGAAGTSQGPSTGSTVAAPGGANGTHVTVNVWGHVVGTSGVSELCDMLNDAVLNQDKTLTATNTKTGVQVVR
jgi:hypothetical protein